jgi:hypothetical protein
MLSESMKADKFSVNAGPTDSATAATDDFNGLFAQIADAQIRKYRLVCAVAATVGGSSGSVNSSENGISSPMAPSIRSRIPTLSTPNMVIG